MCQPAWGDKGNIRQLIGRVKVPWRPRAAVADERRLRVGPRPFHLGTTLGHDLVERLRRTVVVVSREQGGWVDGPGIQRPVPVQVYHAPRERNPSKDGRLVQARHVGRHGPGQAVRAEVRELGGGLC